MTYLACSVLTEAFSKHCLKMHWHLRQQVICRHLLLLFGVSPSTSFFRDSFHPKLNHAYMGNILLTRGNTFQTRNTLVTVQRGLSTPQFIRLQWGSSTIFLFVGHRL